MTMSKENKSREIVDAIITGQNTWVLNHLYKTSLPHIIRFVSMNSGDEEEAKDIFQDAVVALFTTVKLGKFDKEKDVNAYVYSVSRNLWINRVKRRNRQQGLEKVTLSTLDETPLSTVLDEEKKKVIEELLEKAGSKCRDLLRYSLYDNLSMKEIAAKMGFSGEDVAKTSHYRCKQKLIEIVENDQRILDLFKG